jgi:hypothetical protein
MEKRWVRLGLFLGLVLVGLGVLIWGCGQSQQAAVPPSSVQAVTISGTATAAEKDLQQLGGGVTTLALSNSAANENDLIARGIPKSSIRSLGLVPMAVSGTTITVGTLDASGNLTRVATAAVSSNGSYTVKVENYDTTQIYGCVVTKTSDSTKKTLELKAIYPAPSGGEIKGKDAAISSQTTLVAQMIIEKVVKVLETAKIDPKVIASVKDAIITAVDALISAGTITVTTVRDSTATENTSLKENLEKAASDTTIAARLDAIEGSALIGKVTDFASAKGAMFELFKALTGDPRGIPEEIVDAFAKSYLKGITKTIADITAAINKSVYNKSTKTSASGSFTSSQVASEIQGMLRAIYGSNPGGEGPPERVKTVINAVFPKADWENKTIDASTTFNVPQLLLLVHAGERLAQNAGLGLDPPKLAYNLGLMADVENKAKIMHAELRIMTFEEWQNFTPTKNQPKPTPKRVLAAWVDVGNAVNPNASETEGVTCTLTYPKTDGSTSTVSLRSRADKEQHEMGPPPGWKIFSLEPWDRDATDNKRTDFKAGTATFTAKKADGSTLDTKRVDLVDIDLTGASLTINAPKVASVHDAQNMSRFSKGAQPTFNLKLVSVGTTIPDGYRLGYVIQLRKGQFKDGRFFVDWGDRSSHIYDSWEKQDFPPASPGEVINWVVPVALSQEAFYEFGLTLVALNKKTNSPVSEGQHVGGVFIVGNPTADLNTMQQQYNYVPPPTEQLVATLAFTLEGKVHSNFYTNVTKPKVGLFKETPASGGPTLTLVTGIITTEFTAGSTTAGVAYKAFVLPRFAGSALDKGKRYLVLFFDDTNGDSAINTGELFMHSKKGIEYREDGVWVQSPDGGDKLSNSQTGFNFAPWGETL